MRIQQSLFRDDRWQNLGESPGFSADQVQWVLASGERTLLERIPLYAHLRALYPAAEIVITSTSGEIIADGVYDDSIAVVAVEWERTQIRTAQIAVEDRMKSYEAGAQLARQLMRDDLAGVFIISEGNCINGSELTKGLSDTLPPQIPISGGMAGDADRFSKTLVGLNSDPTVGNVVGVGLYGNSVRIGHGSLGGWDVFGPEREVTDSDENVLYAIDGKRALDLYKEYLGKYAKDLPGAALLFPLSMKETPDSQPLVRTILSIDEEKGSMIFAGDMPKGALVRFMKANFDRLVDASATASLTSLNHLGRQPELALLISCVGRKLVLGPRVEEEVEAAREVLGRDTVIAGFYSYGEISPLNPSARCELHNQTMTITVVSEN